MESSVRPTVYHIPICPFCQRLEILLELKAMPDAVDFKVVDITKPRDPYILELTGGSTALPVMELEGGRALKESMVLMEFIEAAFDDTQVRREDPYERALESLLVTMDGGLINAGYGLVMNQDESKREEMVENYLKKYRELDDFLRRHSSGESDFLFERFGWAEATYTPFFQRFAFVDYYEGVDIPETDEFARVRAWRDACVAHADAQQTSDEEVIKLYYDYAKGAGNGAVLPGREKSSFVFTPTHEERPMPPKDKYGHAATDAELGLV
jgi:glutathione S-transferase